MPKAKKGTHIEQEQVTVRRAAEVEVEADRPFAVYADGEHLADLPARLRVLPSGADGDRAAGEAGRARSRMSGR